MTRAVHSMVLGLLLAVTFFLSHHDTLGSSHPDSCASFDGEFSRPEVGVVFGEQYDPDLGLYYLRARFYNPQSGRFWSMDSWEGDSEKPTTHNNYLYGNGDPLTFIDPSGQFGVAGGALGGASIGASIQGMHTDGIATVGSTINEQLMFGHLAGVTSLGTGGAITIAITAGLPAAKIARRFIRRTLGHVSNAFPGGMAALASISRTIKVPIGVHRVTRNFSVRGLMESHHMLQSAAFRRLGIPHDDGLTIILKGSIHQPHSQHWRFHNTLEGFWDKYRNVTRNGGRGHLAGQRATVTEYLEAMRDAAGNAGLSDFQSGMLVDAAKQQLKKFNIPLNTIFPRIPNVTNITLP